MRAVWARRRVALRLVAVLAGWARRLLGAAPGFSAGGAGRWKPTPARRVAASRRLAPLVHAHHLLLIKLRSLGSPPPPCRTRAPFWRPRCPFPQASQPFSGSWDLARWSAALAAAGGPGRAASPSPTSRGPQHTLEGGSGPSPPQAQGSGRRVCWVALHGTNPCAPPATSGASARSLPCGRSGHILRPRADSASTHRARRPRATTRDGQSLLADGLSGYGDLRRPLGRLPVLQQLTAVGAAFRLGPAILGATGVV